MDSSKTRTWVDDDTVHADQINIGLTRDEGGVYRLVVMLSVEVAPGRQPLQVSSVITDVDRFVAAAQLCARIIKGEEELPALQDESTG